MVLAKAARDPSCLQALPQKSRTVLGYSHYRPAVADGYVVDTLDLLMFRIPDRLPKGVPEWLAANRSRVNEFLTWSKNYQWPKESEK